MNRKFIINLIFAIGVNLLIKPFWVLGVERGVQNAIGAEEYGFYFSLFSFAFIFNVILDFGINNYNNTFIAKYPQLLYKKFSQLVILKLILMVCYLILTLTVALFVGYDSAQFQLLLVLCLNQFLSFAITYLRSNISGLQFFFTDSILSVLDRLLMILFCGLLLWGQLLGEMKLTWFVYAQTLSYSITVIICFMVLKPHIGVIKWKWSKPFTIHLLSKSYPYAVLGILMGFYSKIDGVIIERLLPNGKVAAGHYASAYRLVEAANMIAVLFAGLLLPLFARLTQTKDSPNGLLKMSFSLLITPAIVAASVCYFYRSEIIFTLNGTGNIEIENVLALLMVSFVFTCTTYIYGTFLTARGELKLLNRIASAAVIINFMLNFIFIKIYGITAAAWATVITQGFVAILHFSYSHRKPDIEIDLSLLIKIFLFGLLQVFMPFLLQFLNCHFIVKVAIQLLLGMLLLLYLNVLSLSQFKKLIFK